MDRLRVIVGLALHCGSFSEWEMLLECDFYRAFAKIGLHQAAKVRKCSGKRWRNKRVGSAAGT